MSKPDPNYKLQNAPLTTWLSANQVERFRAIARAHGVTPATFLRTIVVDVLDDEAEGFSVYVSPDGEVHYHAHLKGVKTSLPPSSCVPETF